MHKKATERDSSAMQRARKRIVGGATGQHKSIRKASPDISHTIATAARHCKFQYLSFNFRFGTLSS